MGYPTRSAVLVAIVALLAVMAATANAYPILDEHGRSRVEQSTVVLALEPAPRTLAPGESLEVAVVVTATVAIRGLQLSVRFDPSVVEATSFEEGTFLKDWAAAHGGTSLVFPNPPPIDNTAGKAGVVGISVMGGAQGGPTGTGRVGTWRLAVRPDAVAGPSALALADVVVSDANADEIGDTEAVDAAVVVTHGTPGAPSATSLPTATPPSATRAPTSTPDHQVRIDLEPAPLEVAPGSAFDVVVKVTTGKPIRGVQVGLTFDPGAVEATGFTEGAFLKDWASAQGGSTMLMPPVAPIDNAAGTAGPVGASIMGGGDGGPSGSGTFGTFHFRAKAGATGSTRIDLDDGVVVNDAAGGEVSDLVLGYADVSVDVRAPTATVAQTATSASGATATGTPGAGTATATRTSTSGPSTTPVVTATRTPTTSRNSNTKFRVTPASQRVAPGAPFDVQVEVEPDRTILGAQVGLTFDPAVVEVKSVTEGDWLKTQSQSSGGVTVMVPAAPKIDNAAGKVEVTGISIMGVGAQGASTKGVLLTYKMAAKAGASGKSALTLTGAVASDATGEELSISSVTNGEVTVDVNAPTPTASSAATTSGTPGATGTPLSGTGTTTPGAAGSATVGAGTPAAAGTVGTAGPAGVSGSGGPGSPGSARALGSMLPGSGPAPTPMPATVSLDSVLGGDSTLDEDLTTTSGSAGVFIASGTTVTTSSGQAVGSIGIRVADPAPRAPDGGTIVGFAYSFEPNDAVFSPSARIWVGFEGAVLPAGVGAEDLRLGRYDAASGTWADVEATLDADRQALTAEVDRFGVFAVLAPAGGTPWPLLGGLLVGEILVAALALVSVRRRTDLAAYRLVPPANRDVKLLMPPRRWLLADTPAEARNPGDESRGRG